MIHKWLGAGTGDSQRVFDREVHTDQSPVVLYYQAAKSDTQQQYMTSPIKDLNEREVWGQGQTPLGSVKGEKDETIWQQQPRRIKAATEMVALFKK